MKAERFVSARDPLAARAGDLAEVAERTRGRVSLRHRPWVAQVSLRLDPSLADRSSFPLPLEPNTASEDGPRAALWLGPDEWLLLDRRRSGPELVGELAAALDGLHRSVVDVSANRVSLELGGPDRLDLLAGGCSLDLHPRSWREAMCAQTLFGRAQVILHEQADTTGVLVRASFADYVVDRLLAV